mgnify:CR=1 FL=1
MEQALQELLPAITAVVMAVVTGLLSLLTAWLREKFKIEIEARHRQALHSALETGVNRVLDKLVKLPQVTRADAAVDAIAERQVPAGVFAGDVELVRVLEHRLVAVARGVGQEQPVALGDFLARQLGVGRFFVADCGSTDGTREIRAERITVDGKTIEQRGAMFGIGGLTTLWSGLGWMNHLRIGISAMWGIDANEGGSFLKKKLSDLVGLIGLIVAFLIAFGVTAAGSSGQGWRG